ncbi:MAG: DNA-protecting protein DprA [Bacteroidetes bacterium]|nr:DNA-protecting protein DprA [Bacteroidota bacterium]
MYSDEMKYTLALTMVPGIGNRLSKNLIEYFGSASEVFNAGTHHLLRINRIGSEISKNIIHGGYIEQAEKEFEYVQSNDVKVLFYLDQDYPLRLKQCVDSPVLLFYKGTVDLEAKIVIGVCGTRSSTQRGMDKCAGIIKDLTPYDPLIVSGLAYGIDQMAHTASLTNGLNTVAVLGHGLDRIYPYSHKRLSSQIEEQGGLLTEFPIKTKPDRENFPQRNRIIAGLCDCLLVVESAQKGGAMITAHLAASYSRDVFAVPGRTDDFYSKGCHYLIKHNVAALVENADDIAAAMNWSDERKARTRQIEMKINLSSDQQRIVDLIIEKEQITIDDLFIHTKFDNGKLATVLLELELKGIIRSLPGKVYSMI